MKVAAIKYTEKEVDYLVSRGYIGKALQLSHKSTTWTKVGGLMPYD